MPATERDEADLALIRDAAAEAGRIAHKWFGNDPKVWMKEGDSPVSEADFAVDDFLKNVLRDARPDYGWLSEETDDDGTRLTSDRVFVVDPIDGTRGFVQGLKRWCVSIAVIEGRRPVAGVLECPAMGETLSAVAGGGAWRNGEMIARADRSGDAPLRITGPRVFMSEVDTLFAGPVTKLRFVPSLAYRVAMVATGEADLAFARASARDWDLAAADLIVQEAAARLTDLSGADLSYNCHETRHGTLMASGYDRHAALLNIVRRAAGQSART